MEEKTIQHGKMKVTVKMASLGDGLRRMRLITEAFESPQEETELQTTAIAIYPTLRCATKDVQGFHFDKMEDLLELPEVFVNDWMDAALEINPQWRNERVIDKEQVEKKEESPTNSTSG